MSTKLVVLTALFALVVAMSGCFLCPEKIDGERLEQVNTEWYKMYSADRCPTKVEIAEYGALDDEGKSQWRRDGKPVLRPLLDRKLDAVKDYKKAVDAEAEAAE